MTFTRVPSPAGEPISVMFAFNAGYAQHAAASIASLLRNSRSRLDVVIASTADPGLFADRLLRSFAANERLNLSFRHFEVPGGTVFPTPNRLTLETYLRFWIQELMPGRSRAIYLDPDTIVTGPIEELWTTDLDGKVLGAVPIPNSTRPVTHGMPPGSLFFNAGVLLFDLDAWTARGYRDRCLDYLRQHPERALDGDQDILNLCVFGDWQKLPYEWNVINPFFRPSYDHGLAPAELARICREAKIVHFNGRHKPWVFLDNHPRQKDYMRYLADTDWRDWRPADWTRLNRIRKWVQSLLPRRARGVVKGLARSSQTLRGRYGRMQRSVALARTDSRVGN